MARNNKSDRGFAAMKNQGRDQEVKEIASQGGSASGGNFKHDRKKASNAGREGGKRSGNRNS